MEKHKTNILLELTDYIIVKYSNTKEHTTKATGEV